MKTCISEDIEKLEHSVNEAISHGLWSCMLTPNQFHSDENHALAVVTHQL